MTRSWTRCFYSGKDLLSCGFHLHLHHLPIPSFPLAPAGCAEPFPDCHLLSRLSEEQGPGLKKHPWAQLFAGNQMSTGSSLPAAPPNYQGYWELGSCLLALGTTVQVMAHRLKPDSRVPPFSPSLLPSSIPSSTWSALSQAASLCFLYEAWAAGCQNWNRFS